MRRKGRQEKEENTGEEWKGRRRKGRQEKKRK